MKKLDPKILKKAKAKNESGKISTIENNLSSVKNVSKLDLTNFEKAVKLFEKMIKKKPQHIESQLLIIQSFEFAYMECIKMIKRYLELHYNDIYNYQMKLDQTIEVAYKLNLTSKDFTSWDEFRQNRNNTSHEYMEANWDKFYQMAKEFAIEVRFVFDAMSSRI